VFAGERNECEARPSKKAKMLNCLREAAAIVVKKKQLSSFAAGK
jgi:hypothetical protein